MQSFAVPSQDGVTIWFPFVTAADRPPDIPLFERLLEDRLDSWKEIAEYLNRDVMTVQRRRG
jgi:hypothetical protein